jgi:hypothetical protein
VLYIAREGGTRALVKRPSLARYETLVRELTVCQFNLENGSQNALGVGIFALAAVIDFVNADLGMMDAGITNPLSVIVNALHDCWHGGRPPLLFDRPKSVGRPTDQMFDSVKAAAAMGVEVLLAAKMKRGAAGKYMADAALKLGFRRPDGKQISGRTVLNWRDEIETAKSEVGAQVFTRLKELRARWKPITDPEEAKALAEEFLNQARFAGFWQSDVRKPA